ncbi:hypothetical protein CUS07_09860 [Enterococcus faecalis]|nr:hypothetical protein CUS07_09860 [Enterococcus faecalis]PQG27972.1 hypothetical protein CUS39_03095 [Enterococcus faecalis]RXX10471.1 hypothetical protein CYQ20_06270 [Enterococcus faecalis]TQA98238.1 hypothetical protein FKY81_03820 [Enterococcus faecalis]TQB47824.1 hypothetical protein FKY85_12005 [Enterococcus faecalis]
MFFSHEIISFFQWLLSCHCFLLKVYHVISSIAILNKKLTKIRKILLFILFKTMVNITKKILTYLKNNISYYLYLKDYYVIFLTVSAYK